MSTVSRSRRFEHRRPNILLRRERKWRRSSSDLLDHRSRFLVRMQRCRDDQTALVTIGRRSGRLRRRKKSGAYRPRKSARLLLGPDTVSSVCFWSVSIYVHGNLGTMIQTCQKFKVTRPVAPLTGSEKRAGRPVETRMCQKDQRHNIVSHLGSGLSRGTVLDTLGWKTSYQQLILTWWNWCSVCTEPHQLFIQFASQSLLCSPQNFCRSLWKKAHTLIERKRE